MLKTDRSSTAYIVWIGGNLDEALARIVGMNGGPNKANSS